MNKTWARGQNIEEDIRNDRKSYNERRKIKKEKQLEREKYIPPFQKNEVTKPEKPKEFNLYDHPEMMSSNTKVSQTQTQEKISYLDTCKKFKEEHESNIEQLKPGWLAMKNGKYSRNNIDYYDTIDETYTQREKDAIEKYEEMVYVKEFQKILNDAYLKREHESYIYYQETGGYDIFALSLVDQEKYEKYVEQFEIEDSDSSSEDDIYSDNDSVDSYY